jgi:leucyl-tRNA synthetase
LLKFDEPVIRLFNQGMLTGADGEKMSKSKGNDVLPETISEKYGIDVARLFLMSIASPDKDILWNDNGIEGSLRFMNKIIDFYNNVKIKKSSEKIEHKINKTIKKITENVEYINYNLAVINLRELFESLGEEISKEDIENFTKLLSIFCPHVAEELWEKLGKKGFVSLEKWPEADESKINEKFDEIDKVNDNIVSDIMNILKILKEKQGKEGKKIYLYAIPTEAENYNPEEISKRVGLEVEIFAVNDSNKYDPEHKAGKAKLGKPAIFVE